MKGLLIKDYKIIAHNKKMFVIMLIVQLLALQNYDGYSFLIGYNTMIFVLLAFNTISTDEYYRSSSFLMTMPIKRKTYVTEKYALMLGFSFLGAILSIVFCILLHREMAFILLLEGIAIYFFLALFQLLMLPIQLKFGGEKGRIVLISLLACVTVVITSLNKILPGLLGIQGSIGNLIQNTVFWFVSLPAGMITLIALSVFTVCFIISYCISLKILQKKEF